MTHKPSTLDGPARIVGCLMFVLLMVACCGLGAVVGAFVAL